jgi:hypothetical protein
VAETPRELVLASLTEVGELEAAAGTAMPTIPTPERMANTDPIRSLIGHFGVSPLRHMIAPMSVRSGIGHDTSEHQKS